MSQAELRNNSQAHRYELLDNGSIVAFADYELAGDAIRFTHTEVVSGNEGKGFGSSLAKKALDHACAENRKLVPVCEFIASYIAKHPEYQDRVKSES
ncbi:GNAT family N-acetyltransferase [Noviherbaspirillum agri]